MMAESDIRGGFMP